jgi:hypothetical protein
MKFDLTKVIVKGTYRSIGLIIAGTDATKIPIAGMTREAIADALNGTIQAVGKRSLENIFVVVAPPLKLVFVRPQYSRYRKAAEGIFGNVAWAVDYDHVLARSAARKLQYRFVLLVRVTSRVNRSHGRFESAVVQSTNKPDVAFASMRILDKCLGRSALARMRGDPSRRLPYDPNAPADCGLTLKQLGQLGHSLGVEDHASVKVGLVAEADFEKHRHC